jgi:hypothetical protein
MFLKQLRFLMNGFGFARASYKKNIR